jgi:hypothetical protein
MRFPIVSSAVRSLVSLWLEDLLSKDHLTMLEYHFAAVIPMHEGIQGTDNLLQSSSLSIISSGGNPAHIRNNAIEIL